LLKDATNELTDGLTSHFLLNAWKAVKQGSYSMIIDFYSALGWLVEEIKSSSVVLSQYGVARGRASGGSALGRTLGAHQHAFCSHLKARFKQKFRPKYT